ncbi:Putative ribonuclease H protein At1g65750, partial [Linum perenne]
ANNEDEIIWGPDPKGLFSIKSAYEVLAASGEGGRDPVWSTVWHWQGPNRVRFFLWLAAHNRLLTNSERTRRHLTLDDACGRCRNNKEDLLHVLRDCQIAKSTWDLFIPRIESASFFTGNIHEWLARELKSPVRGQLVGIVAWLLWKARNEAVFDNVFATSDQLRLRVLYWIAGVRETMKADDWVKINSDGSVLSPGSLAAAGGIIRDCHGHNLITFAANLGSCSIMRAELRAAEIGLQLAWDLGVKKVILELDSQAAVHSINGQLPLDSRHGPIIHHIQQMRDRDWQVRVLHAYRETNQVADHLAHLGHSVSYGTHIIDPCPPNIRSAIFSDCTGASFPRLISINS